MQGAGGSGRVDDSHSRSWELGEEEGAWQGGWGRGAHQQPFLSFYCMFSVMKERCLEVYAYFTIH